MTVKVICHADFRRQIAAFRSTGLRINTETMPRLVSSAALSAQKLARVNLKELVYTAQLPRAARYQFPKNPERYLEKRRTGQVFKAIKVDPPYRAGNTWIGTVKVDKTDFPTYYYALILNYGGRTIKYLPRPFWSDMERVMFLRFRILGQMTLRDIKGQLVSGVGGLRTAGMDTQVVTDGSV